MGVGSWRESIAGRALSSRAADLDSIPDNPRGSLETLNRELEVVRLMEPSGICLACGPTTLILAPGGPWQRPPGVTLASHLHPEEALEWTTSHIRDDVTTHFFRNC